MAATDLQVLNSASQEAQTLINSNILDEVLKKLKDQLAQGEKEPCVPFTTVSVFGESGIVYLQESLQDLFGIAMTVDIDLFANSVKVLPVMTAGTASSPTSSEDTVPGTVIKTKIARPLNPFILYRKHWHPIIAAQNPRLHNNGISVIIGQKWREESEQVKAEYKRRADRAKKEHAALHPNYTYQPRKPCERRKRMTKGKLAKLAANGMMPPMPIDLNFSPGIATFHAAPSNPGDITSQLTIGRPIPRQMNLYAAESAHRMSEVDHVKHVKHFPLEKSVLPAWFDPDLNAKLCTADSPVVTSEITDLERRTAEVRRQAALSNDFNIFFDIDAASAD